MFKIIVVASLIGLLIWAVKPSSEGLSAFQKMSQFLTNRLDENYSRITYPEEIQQMKLGKERCFRDIDCVLVMCGARPNQSSLSANKYAEINEAVYCDPEGDPVWDGYVRCEKRVCEFASLTKKD